MRLVSSAEAFYRRYAHVGRQFIKFGLVGAAGVAVNMAVAILMNKLNGGTVNAQRILFAIPGTPYNFRYSTLVWIVAFLVANLFNFELNRAGSNGGAFEGGWTNAKFDAFAKWIDAHPDKLKMPRSEFDDLLKKHHRD